MKLCPECGKMQDLVLKGEMNHVLETGLKRGDSARMTFLKILHKRSRHSILLNTIFQH